MAQLNGTNETLAKLLVTLDRNAVALSERTTALTARLDTHERRLKLEAATAAPDTVRSFR